MNSYIHIYVYNYIYKYIHTVRRTLLNSAPTNACRQPDSAHKRKIPLAYVRFTQSKFPFAPKPRAEKYKTSVMGWIRSLSLSDYYATALSTLPFFLNY